MYLVTSYDFVVSITKLEGVETVVVTEVVTTLEVVAVGMVVVAADMVVVAADMVVVVAEWLR